MGGWGRDSKINMVIIELSFLKLGNNMYEKKNEIDVYWTLIANFQTSIQRFLTYQNVLECTTDNRLAVAYGIE